MAREPFHIGDFIGQGRVLRPLLRRLEAAMHRAEPMHPFLLVGNSGLGKTEATRGLASQSGFACHEIQHPVTPTMLIERLREAKALDWIFFDECHRFDADIQHYLYRVMDDTKCAVERGEKTVSLPPMDKCPATTIPPLTLVFATDQPGKLYRPFLRRVDEVRFVDYCIDELRRIAAHIASKRHLKISPQACRMIAVICHGNPAQADCHIRFLRDWFQVEMPDEIRTAHIRQYLRAHRLDKYGLNEMHWRELDALAKAGGRSMSLESIGHKIGCYDITNIRRSIEPALEHLGLIVIVPQKGRMLTEKGVRAVAERNERLAKSTRRMGVES